MEHTYRKEEFKNKLNNRINRLSGQLEGIKRMIEEDRYCPEILNQLRACINSLKSLEVVILNNHLQNCVVNKIQNGDLKVLDEISELLRREL